jgi:hypothetical protein
VDEPFAFVDAPDFTPTYPDPSNPGQRLPYTKLDSEICQSDGLLGGGRTPTGGSQALLLRVSKCWLFLTACFLPSLCLFVRCVGVTEDQRYQCDFTTPLNMRAFPFDRQFMEFLIESYWEVDTLQIIFAEQDKINYLLPTDMPDIVGWSWIQNGYRAMTQDYPYNGGQYHRLIIRTLLERQPDYYLTKIVSGSMLLVYMCVWVFSLAVDEADRMMGTLSSFLGLVTFLFVASGDTPKVPYQTRLDVFMVFSLSDTLAPWCTDDLPWGVFCWFLNPLVVLLVVVCVPSPPLSVCVAVMLFIHGGLYYWREVDVETWLEERHAGRFTGHGDDEAIARASVVDIGKMPGHGRPGSGSSRIMPNPVAEGGVKSADIEMAPSSPSLASGRVYINEPRVDPPRTHGDPFVNPMDYWYLRKSPRKNFEWGRWWRGLHLTRKWVRTDFACAHGTPSFLALTVRSSCCFIRFLLFLLVSFFSVHRMPL